MLKTLVESQSDPFSFIDASCGNGWVVRKVLKHSLCESATGIDSPEGMIKEPKKLDPNGNYVLSDLLEWKPDNYVDMVHSMEVIYYFKNLKKLILHLKDFWLKPGGIFIMGLDFYQENIDSHTWPEYLNTEMKFFSIKNGKNCWKVQDCAMLKVIRQMLLITFLEP